MHFLLLFLEQRPGAKEIDQSAFCRSPVRNGSWLEERTGKARSWNRDDDKFRLPQTQQTPPLTEDFRSFSTCPSGAGGVADTLHQPVEMIEIIKLDLQNTLLPVACSNANMRAKVLTDSLGQIIDRRGDLLTLLVLC